MALPEADKVTLTKELAELRLAIDAAAKAQAKNPRLEEFLADIEIFHKAVDWAGKYNEYFNKGEFKTAHELVAEGKARAASFLKGETPWIRQTGLVVRGYKSKIDGSVQPYGMVIPDNYAGSLMRLDFWCHGRGETLSELAFLSDRRKNVGQLPANNRLVLHLYGRYCCANKMAGEVDLWEAYAHARKSYNIDDDRLFNGSPERYDWKLVGKRELYIPYNGYRLESDDTRYADLLKTGSIDPSAMRYEAHRVWVLEATLKPGKRHIYGKRVLYIDEDTWLAVMADNYDAHGQLWRTNLMNTFYAYGAKLFHSGVTVYHDLVSGAYLADRLTQEIEAPRINGDRLKPYMLTTEMLRQSGR